MIKARLGAASFHGFEALILDQLHPIVEQAVNEGADMLLAEVDRKLSRRGPPIAGAPPAEVTTALRRALRRTPVVWKGKLRARADVEIPAGTEGGEYAGRQEYGGKDDRGRYSPPHPFMRPAAAAIGPKFRRRLQELVNEHAEVR